MAHGSMACVMARAPWTGLMVPATVVSGSMARPASTESSLFRMVTSTKDAGRAQKCADTVC